MVCKIYLGEAVKKKKIGGLNSKKKKIWSKFQKKKKFGGLNSNPLALLYSDGVMEFQVEQSGKIWKEESLSPNLLP